MPRISIVTPCKGRLRHLRRSLPTFLAQPESEVIVVDYDCPDGTADVCAREFPAARVVKVEDAPHFNGGRARNLGAAEARSEWIAFFDADILMAPDFVQRLTPKLDAPDMFHRFYPFNSSNNSACGSNVTRRADFFAAGQYDEVTQGYGGEDLDLYFRLELFGSKPQRMEFDMLAEIIQHPDRERIRFGHYETVVRHHQVNDVYYLVKHSLLRHLGVNGLDEEQREKIYGLIREVVSDATRTTDQPIHFTIELPHDPIGIWTTGWRARRHLVFDLTPQLPSKPLADQGESDSD